MATSGIHTALFPSSLPIFTHSLAVFLVFDIIDLSMSTFDVIDEHDQLLNKVATFEEVLSKGYWHRGVHVIIYTPHKEIVMQKRSPLLSYHPNEIEVSVGGGVEAGEEPIDAAIRETKEEIGISLDKSKMRFIGKTKYNHPTKGHPSRIFLYSFAICVPKHDLLFEKDERETSAVFFISKRKLRFALARHRIAHYGKISGLYSYWQSLLRAVQ
jgi:8-oxo-dGTP pyrophosphatase MutT (NUDIX family)